MIHYLAFEKFVMYIATFFLAQNFNFKSNAIKF